MINQKEVDNLLSEDKAMIIWLSCIDSEKAINELNEIWNIEYDTLYRNKIREKLKNIDLIKTREVRKGTLIEYKIQSKTDWLAEYDFFKGREPKLFESPPLIPFFESSIKNKLAVFESDCFKKVAMNTDRIKRKYLGVIKREIERIDSKDKSSKIKKLPRKDWKKLHKVFGWKRIVIDTLHELIIAKAITKGKKFNEMVQLENKFKGISYFDELTKFFKEARMIVDTCKKANYKIPNEIPNFFDFLKLL